MAEPDVSQSRRDGMRLGWVILFSLLSLLPVAVLRHLKEPNSPVELVAAFLEAVSAGDVDLALSYTDASVPTGTEAAFLHPDAIERDWEVLELTEYEVRDRSETGVKATIGHDGGTAFGRYTVDEASDGTLSIKDPLVWISAAPSSQTSVRIGNRTLDRSSDDVLRSVYGQSQAYALLPGVYRFYGGEPIAVLEHYLNDDPIEVLPPSQGPTPEQAAVLQVRVNELIDDCLEYRLAAPPGCPFSTDGHVDTPGGERLEKLEVIEWTLDEYPQVSLVETYLDQFDVSLLVVQFTESGRLELHGMGTEDYDEWVEFTTPCHFAGNELVAFFHGDDVEFLPLGASEEDTCRGTI